MTLAGILAARGPNSRRSRGIHHPPRSRGGSNLSEWPWQVGYLAFPTGGSGSLLPLARLFPCDNPVSFDPHPIRWIDIVLPHPEESNRWLTLKADGPYALRHWYYAPGTRTEIRLHLHLRTPDGGLTGCLHCGESQLYTRRRWDWRPLGYALIPAILLGWFFWWAALIAIAVGLGLTWAFSASEIVCYGCGTQHRGFREEPKHAGFDGSLASKN